MVAIAFAALKTSASVESTDFAAPNWYDTAAFLSPVPRTSDPMNATSA